jgi:AraC-like DNA-binding protein
VRRGPWRKVSHVLAAIHREPERDWSVPRLAEVMGASRSSFIDKFSNAVGETPAQYVARVKMCQARHWIAHEGMRVAVVANRLGYDSEASFSRAFKRVIGHPPRAARAG